MNKDIKKLCEIISKDLAKLHKGDTVSALWPFIPNEAEYYVGSFFIKNLYETIQKLKEKNNSKERIAKLFDNSSKIAQYFTLFHSAKILKPSQREELAEDLMSFLSYYRKDIFCENGKNVLLNPKFNIDYLNGDKENVELSNKLSALLLLYLEILYPTMMRMGHEFHGVYEKEGKKIFIKEFFNLNPESLGIDDKFPASKIKIVDEIEGEIELDFFNHLFKSSKKKASYILIDDKILEKNEMEEFYDEIEEKIKSIISKAKLYDRKDWFKVYARGIFNSIKKLKDSEGILNKIPLELFDKIDKEDFKLPIDKIIEFNKTHSKKEIERITKDSFLNIFKNKNGD